jgi:hypothetical protein
MSRTFARRAALLFAGLLLWSNASLLLRASEPVVSPGQSRDEQVSVELFVVSGSEDLIESVRDTLQELSRTRFACEKKRLASGGTPSLACGLLDEEQKQAVLQAARQVPHVRINTIPDNTTSPGGPVAGNWSQSWTSSKDLKTTLGVTLEPRHLAEPGTVELSCDLIWTTEDGHGYSTDSTRTVIDLPAGKTLLLGGVWTHSIVPEEFTLPFVREDSSLNQFIRDIGTRKVTEHTLLLITPRIRSLSRKEHAEGSKQKRRATKRDASTFQVRYGVVSNEGGGLMRTLSSFEWLSEQSPDSSRLTFDRIHGGIE